MKIELKSESGVSIIVASQTETLRDFEVLRAGIKKFLASGKNRIILELQKTETLPTEAIRELVAFDALARELSGRVLLSGIHPQLRERLEKFAAPPVISWFETTAQAMDYFKNDHTKKPLDSSLESPPKAAPKPAAAAEPSPAAPATAPPAATSAPAAAAPDPAALEAQRNSVVARETGDVGTLRKQLSALKSENASLREQMLKLVVENREIRDEDAYRKRISALEAELARAFDSSKAGAPPKPA